MKLTTRKRAGVLGLLSANGISLTGTSMTFLAVPWFVMTTTGSATMMGIVTMAEMLPYVLMQGLGGPLVDRLGSLRTSVLTDLVAAIAMASLPLAHVAGLLGPAILLAAVFVAGTARGAGDIARRVLLPLVSTPAGLALDRASGFYDGVGRLAGLIGAPLAGLLIAWTSAPLVLAVDAVSFALSALLVATAVAPGLSGGAGIPRKREASYLRSLKEGMDQLRGDRLLLAIAALVLVTNFLDQAYASVLLPLWVRERLGSPIALGAISAAFGIGAVAGNAIMAVLAPRLPRRLPFALSFLVCGAPRFLALAFASSLSPIIPVAVLSGLGAGGINPALGAVEYERVPPPLRARVLGAVNAFAWAGIPLGGLAGGMLSDAVGLRLALSIAGLCYLLATLSPFFFPVWRQMERGTSHSGGLAEEAAGF